MTKGPESNTTPIRLQSLVLWLGVVPLVGYALISGNRSAWLGWAIAAAGAVVVAVGIIEARRRRSRATDREPGR